MSLDVIKTLILNSPFTEPSPHFRFCEEGINNEIDPRRRNVATALNLWGPAVNNHGGFGSCVFVGISDRWHAAPTVHRILATRVAPHAH